MKTKITHFPRLIAILTVWLAMLFIASNVYADNSPLCFTAKGGSVTVRFEIKNATHTIQYSTNGTSWSNYTSNSEVTINANQSVYFRAASNQTSAQSFGGSSHTSSTSRFYFSSPDNGKIDASGNIMSLYGPDCPDLQLHSYAFQGLFQNCKLLLSAPILPSTKLNKYCYNSMFYGCSALKTAPALPATTLADCCYYQMFYGCSSLKKTPILPATTLTTCCYYLMFYNCKSLNTIETIPATVLADNCCDHMFYNCQSLIINTNGPGKQWKIPATTSAKEALKGMFTGTGGTMNGTPSVNTTYYIASSSDHYNVTVNINDSTMGDVTGSGSYSYGDTAIVTATANTGYHFVNWSDGNIDNPRQIVVTQNTLFTAIFDTDESAIDYLCVKTKRPNNTVQLNEVFETSTSSSTQSPAVVTSPYSYDLEYSFDGNTWTTYTIGRTISLSNIGDSVMFRGNNMSISRSDTVYCQFQFGNTVEVSGNIMTLVDKTGKLTTIPNDYCFAYLFKNCSTMVSAPRLPATILKDYCYEGLFQACSGLTTAPILPATTMAIRCYRYMFMDCSSLETAPSLPARNLAMECYSNMFRSCSTLTTAPTLPATNLAYSSYNGMFYNCTSLTKAPNLPATTLSDRSYCWMFYGCSSLKEAPLLPATKMTEDCYYRMFQGCSALVVIPPLPATILAEYCYYSMFQGCASLTTLPSLPATTLANACYYHMFDGCTSLIVNESGAGKQWKIPATTIAGLTNPLKGMFTGTSGTMNGTPSVNTPYYILSDTTCIPLCFTARNGNVTVRFEIKNVTHTIQYSTNGTSWSNYTSNSDVTINANQSIYFRAASNQTTAKAFGSGEQMQYTGSRFYFTSSNDGTVEASGNIMSLYGPDCPNLSLPSKAFAGMFSDCNLLTTAPLLPATYLGADCYNSMFYMCTSLVKASDLPAMTMASTCYENMFRGCTSLQKAPKLPALNLAYGCYDNMFYDCTSLTIAPELPATTLPYFCYASMFFNCYSLKEPPVLPVISLSAACCVYMFKNCTSMVVNKVGPGKPWKITTSSGSGNSGLSQMFTGTSGTMNGTPSVNTTYYIASSSDYYTVTVNINDSTMGNVTGSNYYSYGDTAILTAIPKASYHFVSWNDGNTDNPRQIVVSQDTSFQAIFGDSVPRHRLSDIAFKMIKVDGGTFQMGSTIGEDDEEPVHTVTLSDYYIGETEVTQALWEMVMGSNPSYFQGDSLPVETVSWDDCQIFIAKLNQMTGRTFTLPTEAQWEFAARGGNKSQGYRYSGSNTLDDIAWCPDNSSGQTHPVGTKQPNELGIYDMSGNVWEWCSDWYGAYSSSSQTNPTGSSSSSGRHVYRGGSWIYDGGGVDGFRTANRNHYQPTQTYRDQGDFGLRLALVDTNENDSVIIIESPRYLNFTAVDDTATIKLDKVGTPYSINLQYSLDDCRTWNNYTISQTVTLPVGKSVFFKATSANSMFSKSYNDYYKFVMTGSVEASGNIMSLLDATMSLDSVPYIAFYSLFINCSSLLTPPSLPAHQLSDQCYLRLFRYCDNLRIVPVLPAKRMKNRCYADMFMGCEKITEAPVLHSTSLASYCYYQMFAECSSLITPPILPSTTVADYCYGYMFRGCISMDSTPVLPAVQLSDYCYEGMFDSCINIVYPPALPAINLANYCYYAMFKNCLSMRLNPTGSGYVWKIPSGASASAATALNWGEDIFLGTLGDLQGAPIVGKDYYVQPTVTMALLVNDSTMGSVIGSGDYAYGSNVVITAIPSEHHHFVNWSNGSTDATASIIITSDTLLTATFAINPTYSFTETHTICQGEIYNWHNKNLSVQGVYYDSLKTVYGEDSVYELTLTVNPAYLIQETYSICQGETYSWRSRDLTTAGVYYDSLNTTVGCDSVYELTLTVNPTYLTQETHIMCQGETYNWHNKSLTASGVYYDSLQTTLGCDSVYELTLTVNPKYLIEDTIYALNFPYRWHGRDIVSSGIYYDSLTTEGAGCDSIYKLTVIDSPKPLCFTAKGGSVTVRFDIKNVTHTIQYSTDGTSWSNYTSNTDVAINANQSIYFRAASNQTTATAFGAFDDSSDSRFYFSSTDGGMVEASGNIMSLYGPDCPNLQLQRYAFQRMFSECSLLTIAPSLPATNLASTCYASMFWNCSSLTTAPSLPATNLAVQCYMGMFFGCSSMTIAPSLPATNLAYDCYAFMFSYCISLTTAPSLPATNLAKECYYCMFSNCTSLTTAPSLPATNLADRCYHDMFNGCTSLTTAPSLPATNLAKECYYCMFSNCTSLTTAPSLPATNLAKECYYMMFYGCRSLTTAPSLPATNLADHCYNRMFGYCRSLTTAPSLPATNLANHCYEEMFSGCTSLTTVPLLQATTLADSCYLKMFSGCTSLIVNTTGPGKQWKIPAATIDGLDNPVTDMFTGTSGTMNGTPLVNTTYYLTSGKYSVTVNVNDSTMGSALGNGLYEHGDTAILVAFANPNYHFVRWSNGMISPTISLEIFGDTSLTAIFEANQTYFIPETHTICQGETYNWHNKSLTASGIYYDSLKTQYGSDSVYQLTLTVNPTYLIQETHSICQGETYTWRSKNLSTAGVYYDSLKTVAGCDSVYELTLTVNPTYFFPETHAICQGETYTWRTKNLTTAGIYYDSLKTVAGCDSVYELTLTVNPTYLFPETYSICQGETYTWRERNLTTAGVYYDSLKTTVGCDSVYELTLTVNPTYLIQETYSICQGETYTWRTKNLTTAGVYYDSLKTVAGCDSVYELTLTVNPTYFIQETYSICQGETYTWRNKNLLTSGIYYDSLKTIADCDSVYELTLTVNPTYLFQDIHSICQGETYSWKTKNLTTSGVYYDSLQTAAGCDSVYELTLTVNPTYFFPETYSICQGETYNWRNKSLTNAGVFYDSLQTVANCDSVYELTLTVNPTYLFQETYSICQGETYNWRNRSLTNAGVYYDSLQTVAGCDSVYELTLTVNPTYLIQETYSICQGETYTWRGRNLTTSGVYYDSLNTAVGCDSVYELTLTVNPTYFIQETHSICQGETYTWRNRSLTTAGVYYDSLKTVAGCDSVYELTLTVNPTYLFQESYSICQGETYSWRTKNLTTAGVYYDSLQTVAGCDSVYELTLTVNPTYLFQETYSICQGETYTWRNRSLTTAGVYYDSLQTVAGCDSVYELTLTVNPTHLFPETYSICQGETYTWRNRSLTTAGVYYDSLKTVAGCDSVYELTLTVNPTYFFPETYSICQGETYSWRNRSLTNAGVFYDSLKTVAGCDSVYELTLTVNPTYLIPETYSICQGETYSWRTKNLTNAGVYYDSLKTVAGCDSVYELTLTVNPTYLIPETYSICQGETYNWRNKSLTNAGVYYDSLQTVAGCDSVYELTLIVNPTYLMQETYFICQGETYTWRNKNLTTAGVYYDSLKTVAGCDSVYELTLIVNPTYLMQETYSICQGETYTWRTRNLSTTGVYYDSLKTAAGCDSVYELTLTVNPTYLMQETYSICQGETYTWRTRNLTTAGVYYDSLKTVAGCDSVYELTLTVNPTYFFPETYSICQGETYTWRSKNLSTTGVYYDSLKTVEGCDSVYELALTVNPTYFFQETHSICQGETYTWRNKNLSTSGIYYDSLKTGAGCDSVYELTLTVNPTYFIQESDVICHGDVYNWHSKKITDAGVYYDSLKTMTGCDSVYELTLTINNYNVSVNVNDANAGKAYLYIENAETSFAVVECGETVELHAETFADYHFVEWSDGTTDSIRNVEVVGDTSLVAMFEPNCGEWANWPVVFKYNSLLILNVDSIYSMGYYPNPEDVAWYKVIGEPDDLNDIFPADDQYICKGYYMSLITNDLSYGQYYAVVDVSNNAGVLCHDKMRTEIVEYAYNGKKTHIELAPTNVKDGDVMTVFGLVTDEETTLMVYDYSGKLIETVKSNGSDKCQITAVGSAGVYMVNVVSESVNETLKFIVTK